MADKDTNEKATSHAETTTMTANLPYLAKAYGMPEDTVKEFLAAPTTEMVQQFLEVAQTIAQERDKLKTGAKEFIFRFMDLPAELRLRIYELVFQDALEQRLPIALKSSSLTSIQTRRRWTSKVERCIAMELLHTSHIIRSEVLPAAIKIAKILKERSDCQNLAAPDSSHSNTERILFDARQRRLQKDHDIAEEVLRRLEMLGDGK